MSTDQQDITEIEHRLDQQSGAAVALTRAVINQVKEDIYLMGRDAIKRYKTISPEPRYKPLRRSMSQHERA